jgi:ubiquinone/menaquinone biosynthesis C-methylase UbiE
MPFDEAYYQDTHGYDEAWYRSTAWGIINLTYGLEGRVLDVGCGRGYMTKALLEQKRDVVGIDISDYAVSHPIPGCEGKLIRGDIQDIPFKDDYFRWVVCWMVLEHIPEGVVAKALKEIARVAPLSVMCLSILFNDDPWLVKFNVEKDASHITLKSLEWWKDKFAEARLKIEYFNGTMIVILKRY